MSEQRASPAVFAGVKYYDKLLEAMDATRAFAMTGDYYQWVGTLRQVRNWAGAFINDPGLEEELRVLHYRAMSITAISKKDPKHTGPMVVKLRDDIYQAEGRLYAKMKDLLLKFGGEESSEWSEEELARMMS